MSNPAQDAVGAETMTAGLTLTFDPSKLFDAVAQVGGLLGLARIERVPAPETATQHERSA